MELFIISLVAVCLLYASITWMFNKLQWFVVNYKQKAVPYSLGMVFILLLIVDYLLYNWVVADSYTFLYLFFVWSLGFVDDKYGKPYPKGIKGHMKLFIVEKRISTGLLKAVGVVFISFFYALSLNDISGPFILPVFLLLFLLPHTMNLLDTKPLRVWKVTIIVLSIAIVLLQWNFWLIGFYILITGMWAIFESKMLAMLGDNGAMLVGSLVAIFVIESNQNWLLTSLLLFSLSLTWIAERISIQKWVENTPGIRLIDKLGRVE